MPFTLDELADINNAALDNFLDKGEVFKQNVANKPMLDCFNSNAGRFAGGKGNVSFRVKPGQGGGSLVGYTGSDRVAYYNPTGLKSTTWPWREHHIGTEITHTEMKIDGIDIVEDGADYSERRMEGREEEALANLLDEKHDSMGEDYAVSLDSLIHGDGTSDSKALAGIQSIVLADPSLGSTGGINRTANTWWRNRASTAAATAAGSGLDEVTSSTSNGGALIQHLQKEWRQLGKFRTGQTKYRFFAGSDFIDAYETELRANGNYAQTGWSGGDGNHDGAMDGVKFKKRLIEWDPTLDDLGLEKRCYFLDVGKKGLRLLYMDGQRMKKHKPARPYDRYTFYNGITMTGVMVARQLNTSMVVDIA